MARALAAAIAVSLLAVSGAGGAGTQTPKRGGTIVIGAYGQPPCLSLQSVCGVGLEHTVVLGGTFGLKGHRWVPGLARVTRTKDPLTLVYHIRPEARWSDGTAVTSGDFVFTHRLWIRYGLVRLGETVWSRVQPLGRKSFRVTLARRSADWRVYPLFVAPRHALAGEDLSSVWRDTIDNPKTGEPIGSGPFLVERFERGEQITLVRNPRYWGPHTAYLDRVVVRLVPRGLAGVDALLQGEIDVLPTPLPEEAVTRLRRAPGIELRVYPGIAWEQLAIRVGPGGHPALKNKLVRRALAYGIDREAIVRELFGEIDRTLRPLDSLLFLSEESGYRPNWRSYRYRPAEARRLLEQAGCQRGADGIYACGRERLSLRFVTTAGNPRRQRTLELAQAQLRGVGIEVRPIYSPGTVLFGQLLPSGEWDVALFALSKNWPEDLPDAAYRCQGDFNFSGYCNRLVTRDLAQLDAIIDSEQLARVGNAADRKLARDVPAIPLFQRPEVDAIRTTVRIPDPPSAYAFYLNLQDWWLER
ncbi:MAG TPA: ABC transporter substrate-binding protein [Gaiellaceae bacterium]|nr:ABC transporter substrate-binding protein [Gaiellaceae bacterium]